jgi:phosphoglycerate kinase
MEDIDDGWMGLDAGEKSRQLFADAIKSANFWNGPSGVFEFEAFSNGSKAMLAVAIETKENGATFIVGGGDTVTVVAKFGGEGS